MSFIPPSLPRSGIVTVFPSRSPAMSTPSVMMSVMIFPPFFPFRFCSVVGSSPIYTMFSAMRYFCVITIVGTMLPIVALSPRGRDRISFPLGA